ncbi:MAG: YjgP/YjgQ family permease [candidate division Zixibacteria bacterium]|nr:YjgP/YjgQ family permease [candidate division Zixibacteria bacterium]
MMRILWKYVIKELVGPFLFGLAVITFVLLMDFILDVLNRIINKGLPAPVVLEVFALSLAWMLALSIPMAALIAALMGYGRLSADSEVIAFKACGVSLINLVIPGLLLGCILAAGLIWFNDQVLPESNHRARLLMSDITRKKPTWNLEENIFLDYFDGYYILVKEVDNESSKIGDVTIFEHKDPKAPRTITADHGDIEFSADGSRLIMNLFDGEIHEPDPENPERYQRVNFKKQTLTIEGSSTELVRSSSGARGDREMPIRMMIEENRKFTIRADSAQVRIDSLIRDELNELVSIEFDKDKRSRQGIKLLKQARASKSTKDLLSKIDYQSRNIKTYRRQVNSRSVEIHKKFSIPVACIAFILIGAPLGVMTRKGGMATSIGLSLLFFIIYWAFLIGGEELADRMFLSGALAMWLPNIIIGGAGILLIYHVNRKTTVEGFDFIKRFLPGSKK